MRLVISNIPDGANFEYVIDGLKRLVSDEVEIEQVMD